MALAQFTVSHIQHSYSCKYVAQNHAANCSVAADLIRRKVGVSVNAQKGYVCSYIGYGSYTLCELFLETKLSITALATVAT